MNLIIQVLNSVFSVSYNKFKKKTNTDKKINPLSIQIISENLEE